ncbi:MAG: hypothetical protein WCC27_09820 [Acidobacteriaceae bacterium]
MVFLRLIVVLICLGFYLGLAAPSHAQSLPDAPRPSVDAPAPDPFASSPEPIETTGLTSPDQAQAPTPPPQPTTPTPKPRSKDPVDAHGNPIPLERREPQRILGFMPNFRTVSGGSQAHPAGWKYNFTVATHQAFDYSSFIFLGLTSLTAEGFNEHPALGKGFEGMGQYTWRGFLDKTDNTYLSAGLLPTLLREDTRYYALGAGHSIYIRPLYVISQEAVARTYGGRKTPNIAGLLGKAGTQYISRFYYPPSVGTVGALAEKFGYSVMRDVAFSSVREFYPDIAAHYVRKHEQKAARRAAQPAPAKPAPATP